MPKITVITLPETTIVGLKYHGKGLNQEIPQLWGTLNERREDVVGLDVDARSAYGISIMDADFGETGVFDYVAGFPVESADLDQPEDLATFTIPEGMYAKVLVPNLASIQEGFDAIYERWLPASDYVLDLTHGNFCFERYGEEFMPETGSEKFFVYAPVKEK